MNEWLESSIESYLGMRLAAWSIELAIHDFASSNIPSIPLSSVRTPYILPANFGDSGKRNFHLRDQ